MELAISLDSGSAVPLHRQLYERLRGDILAGRLGPGEKLPSTRALAESLEVSRTTITLSYEQLLSEGYLEASVGSGTFVSRQLPEELLYSGPVPAKGVGKEKAKLRLSEYGESLVKEDIFDSRFGEVAVRFRHGRPDYCEFPMQVWRRLLLRHCRTVKAAMLDYAGQSKGYRPLREAITRYLSRSRAVRCSPDQVVIVNGSQQALDLAARVLLNRGDIVALEDPGYLGARRAFRSQGARLIPIPVDGSGLEVSKLRLREAQKSRAVYVTPSHQFPTGFVLTLSRRLELLDWSERVGAVVIEDDYDSEYRYEGRPLPALQGLDESGRVLYIGTFSKVLFPALRLGYLVAPEPLSDLFAKAKWIADRQAPLLEQYVLTDFINEGFLERHIRRMRRIYDQRRRALVDALQQTMGSRISVQGENAGMHLLVKIRSRLDPTEIIRRAERQGVGLISARPYYLNAKRTNEFVLGYANLSVEKITDGVRRLAEAIG